MKLKFLTAFNPKDKDQCKKVKNNKKLILKFKNKKIKFKILQDKINKSKIIAIFHCQGFFH